MTVRARPLPAVEREQPRIQGLVPHATGPAEEALVVHLLGALGEHVDHAVAEAQAVPQHGLHAQASGLCGAHHDVDVVLVETLESLLEYRRGEGGHGPVDAGAAVAQPPGRHHHVLVIALAPAHHRAQHGDVLAAVLAPHPVQYPAAGERGDGAAALGAVLLAHLGIQQPQVVVELGDGGHGGVPAPLAEALLDGHGGRNACQHVHVGPGHDLHELPRVGGEAVDVAPLAVRVDDVEGQGRFPGAAEAGHHHQPVPGDIDGDVLEIVLLGADDPNRRRSVRLSRPRPARGYLGQGRSERGRRRTQVVLEVAPGVGPLHRRHLRGRARGHHLAAAVAALGPQVDDVVGALDDLGVVFDDHHRVALVDELLQGGEQPADIVEVETGGGLVEDEERSGPGRTGDVGGQLEALGFPAGKGGDGLAQPEVVEPHPGQRPEPAHDLRLVPEELHGLGDGEAEHVVDVLVAVGDLQDLLAIAGAAAFRAGGEDVREELHLDPLEALAAAGLAPSPLHVEGEGGGGVAPEPRQVHAGEQPPDRVERLHVGHRVRPGRGAQRRLVHEDHLGYPVDAANLVAVRQGRQRRGLEAPDVPGDDLVHQARLARPGHAGDAHQPAQGNAHVDVLEVVGVGAAYLQGASLYPGPVTDRPRDNLPLGEVVGREGGLAFQQLVIGAGEHHLAAVLTRPRTQVDDVVALLDDLRVVLHHHHGIVVGSEAVEDLHQAVAVPRMQADGGLVQHVQRIHQGRADGGGQVHPLELAPGQGPGLTVEGQVLQAHAHEIVQAPADLVEHQTRHLIVARVEFQGLKVGMGVGYAHAADVRDVPPGDPEVQALGLEPRPLAIDAGHVTPVARQEHADVHLVALPLQPLEPAADAVILPVLPASFAVDDQPAVFFFELGEGAVQRDAPAPAELLELPHLPARDPGGPWLDNAVGDGLGRVRNHQVEVEVDGAAEAVAGLAGPERTVEGEEIGLGLGVGQVAGGAVQAVAEALPAPAVLHLVEG